MTMQADDQIVDRALVDVFALEARIVADRIDRLDAPGVGLPSGYVRKAVTLAVNESRQYRTREWAYVIALLGAALTAMDELAANVDAEGDK